MDEVKAFARRENLLTPRGAVDKQVVAREFGIDADFLHQLLSNKKRPEPALSTLRTIATRMGIEVAALVSSHRPPFVPSEEWSQMDEATRAAWEALYQNLRHTKSEELLIIVGMITKAQEIGRARSADEHIKIN